MNNQYLFSSTYKKNNNSCSIFHKTKGIPLSIDTRKVFLNMSIAVLTQYKDHSYYVIFPPPHHSDFDNHKPLSISFNRKIKNESCLAILSIRLPISGFPYRKRIQFKLSHFYSKKFACNHNVPFNTNNSTLLLQDANQGDLFITKRKREIIYSSFSNLSPYLICFLIQSIIFEGFFSFLVSFKSFLPTNKTQPSRKIPVS